MTRRAEGPAVPRPRGFTLIELLVVIAIIAILMGILMPALKKAKNQGQSVACQGNLKNFTYAVNMYAQDNDDLFCHPGSCYFSQLDAYPGEVGGRWKRWCNGDLYLWRSRSRRPGRIRTVVGCPQHGLDTAGKTGSQETSLRIPTVFAAEAVHDPTLPRIAAPPR